MCLPMLATGLPRSPPTQKTRNYCINIEGLRRLFFGVAAVMHTVYKRAENKTTNVELTHIRPARGFHGQNVQGYFATH